VDVGAFGLLFIQYILIFQRNCPSDKLQMLGGAGATYKIEAIVSVDEQGQMVFLHCNARHHSSGLISGVKNPNDSSLHHVMVDVSSLWGHEALGKRLRGAI